MVSVVKEIRKVAAMFAGPPEDRERSFSRRASPERASGSSPTNPSKWMLGDGKVMTSAMFFPSRTLRIPSIEAILHAFEKSKDGPSPTIQTSRRADRSFFCMRIGRPGAVPLGMLDSLFLQARCRSVQPEGLLRLWRERGIVSEAPQAFAQPVSYTHLTLPTNREV